MIPLSVPNLKGNEKEYVLDAIEKEWVSTGGSYIDRFETEISNYLGVQSAVACQSGTSGLHLSLLESGISIGDEVIVPTLTFIAAVNPVKYLNANPIFMDCDDTLCIDVVKIKEFIEKKCRYEENKLINNRTGAHIKAIVAVHVFGNMCDMESLTEICKKYSLKLIEDATEALGTYYTNGKFKGQYAGTIGDYGVFSFNGNKIITSGGGGMIVSKHAENLNHIKYLSTQAKNDELHYTHHEIGFNYRMTNVQAAIGLAQLEQLEDFIIIKEENYSLYKKGIEESDYKLIEFNDNIRPNYWFYSLKINNNYNIDNFIKSLGEKSIQTRPIWDLNHLQKPYKENESYKIEKALLYVDSIINIPCSSNLNQVDVNYVCNTLLEIEDK